jgi:hypothetical protein
MAKGFATGGGELVHFRVQPRLKAELQWAARQLGVALADVLREAAERWLIEHQRLQAEADAE